MNQGGHMGRHYWAMPAHDIGETLLDKLRRLMRGNRKKPLPGRRRIDPAMPYGHWAQGWEGPVYPIRRASGEP